MTNNKEKKVFISHSSKDVEYVKKLVELFEDIGVTEGQVVCSSIPGYGIPLGEDIYDWLAKQFRDFSLHVLFILSDNYYKSIACQNEMGATWVLKTKYDTILLPNFEFPDIKGAINPNQIGIKLDGDEATLKQHLNELKDTLVEEFCLAMPSASKWERNRQTFLDGIATISVETAPSDEDCDEIAPVLQDQIILTPEAKELLAHAVKDSSGQIMAINMLRGVAITTNSRPFCSPGAGPKVTATWKSALEELEENGFVEAVSLKREVFAVTRAGYDYGETLGDKNGLQIAPVRDDIEALL